MPITDAGRFLFARDPLGNPSPQAGQQQGTRRLDNEGGAGGQEIVHAEPSTSHQRPWKGAKPTGIKTMVETSFRCCLTLSCVERFARGDNDAQRLHLEQKNFARLPSASARLQWVREHVPFAKVGRREGSLYSAGSLVCNKFFRLAYGVSANTIENAKRNPKAPTKRGLRWGGGFRARKDPQREKILLAYLDWYADVYGQHMPHQNATYFYMRNKKELHDTYAAEATRLGEYVVSQSYFYRTLRSHRPQYKMRSGCSFMKCHSCTLYHDTLNGTAGIRVSADPETMKRAAAAQAAHMKAVTADRERLSAISSGAIRAKANMEPLKFVSMQADAAAQTAFALPMCSPLTHGTDRGYAERQKVMAVVVEGQFVDFFLSPLTVGGGSNLICTAIHRSLTRLFDLHCDGETPAYIDELYLQLDNCVGENKNHVVIAYLGYLVARRTIGRVEINFMMVGHTHIMIDQVFSRISIHCKGVCLFTRGQQAEAFRKAYTALEVFTTTLRSLGNFKGVFTERGRVLPIRGVTQPRSFEIRPAGAEQVTVGMKKNMHDAVFTGKTPAGIYEGDPHPLFRMGVPDIECAPPFELKEVDAAVRENIAARYNAVHTRLAALYPLDVEKQRAIKDDMATSHRLLAAKGSVPWNLPCHWLRCNNVEESGGSQGEGTGDNEDAGVDGRSGRGPKPHLADEPGVGGAHDSVQNDGDEVGGDRADGAPDDLGHLPSFTKGDFVFFLGDKDPFLVGKVTDERVGGGGEAEVEVRWWSPATSSVRNNASDCSIGEYGKGKMTADFKTIGDGTGGAMNSKRGKRRLVPDVEWMQAALIVASCSKLNSGDKIPKGVLDTLKKRASG